MIGVLSDNKGDKYEGDWIANEKSGKGISWFEG